MLNFKLNNKLFIKQDNTDIGIEINDTEQVKSSQAETEIDELNLNLDEVIVKEENGIRYLQFKKLLEYKNLVHAYPLGLDLNFRTGKISENLQEKDYDKAIDSYKKICKPLNCNYINIVKPVQRHTNNVKIVENKILTLEPDINLKEYDQTDGLITNKKDLILSTTNADCILMLFYDFEKNVIANIHSGWKGTLKKISEVTVKKMINVFNCNPENIICAICPSIRKCHFEVREDVKNSFIDEFKGEEFKDCFEEKEKNVKWNIDTVLINKILLKKLGLKEENILDSRICSMCNSHLVHSYRAEKEGYGLGTALVGLV